MQVSGAVEVPCPPPGCDQNVGGRGGPAREQGSKAGRAWQLISQGGGAGGGCLGSFCGMPWGGKPLHVGSRVEISVPF